MLVDFLFYGHFNAQWDIENKPSKHFYTPLMIKFTPRTFLTLVGHGFQHAEGFPSLLVVESTPYLFVLPTGRTSSTWLPLWLSFLPHSNDINHEVDSTWIKYDLVNFDLGKFDVGKSDFGKFDFGKFDSGKFDLDQSELVNLPYL
jgi:hypothetical protein